jgi:hypothetical protein
MVPSGAPLEEAWLAFHRLETARTLSGELLHAGQLMPNEEPAKLAVAEDSCMERYAQKMFTTWNEKAPGGLKDRPGETYHRDQSDVRAPVASVLSGGALTSPSPPSPPPS